MGSTQVFSVLTEFKFDVAQAVAGSDTLQKSTKKLSEAADQALVSVQTLGLGLVEVLGYGGVIGFFKKAIDASDSFQSSILDMNGVLTSQLGALTGPVDTLNERLGASRDIMEQVAKQAKKFDVSTGDVSGVLGTLIGGAAQNTEDTSMKSLVGMSGQVAAGASGIGLSPTDMATQVAAIMGSTATQGALVNVLQTMPSAFKGKSLAGINAMDDDEIMKRLSAGLQIIASDMSDLSARSELLSYQITRFKNIMTDIIKPIGDAIRPVLVNVMKEINGYMKTAGAGIFNSFGSIMKLFVSTPREMLTNLLQFREAHSDLGKAAKTVGTIQAVEGIGWILAKLTGKALFLTPVVGQLAFVFSMLGDIMSRDHSPIMQMIGYVLKWGSALTVVAGILSYFGVLMPVLAFAFAEILAPLALLYIMFQAISRAMAKAHISDALAMAEILPKFMGLLARLGEAVKQIFLPVWLAIDGLSSILAPLFEWSGVLSALMPILEAFVFVLETVGTLIVNIMAAISGAFGAIFNVLSSMSEEGWLLNIFDNIKKGFQEGFDDFIGKHKKNIEDGTSVRNANTDITISKVEIRNDFKAGMEPDRIAYTIKEQLMNAHNNPVANKGGSFQGKLLGA
jgi:hypothetical protein